MVHTWSSSYVCSSSFSLTTGFVRQFRELRDYLRAQPDVGVRLKIIGLKDEKRTDQFVVRVINNNNGNNNNNNKKKGSNSTNESNDNEDDTIVYTNLCRGQGIDVTDDDKIDIVEHLQELLVDRMVVDW